jgi:tRNA(fMet)-specific endonuclease VapC
MIRLPDTNVCVDTLRGHPRVCARLAATSPADCAVSSITSYELMTGACRSAQPEREKKKVQQFLAAIHVLPFDRAAGDEAARLRHELESAGTKIGPYDVLLAGHALASSLTLITANTREFARIAGLRLEDWRA